MNIKSGLVTALFVMILGCSGEDSSGSGEHVWKGQTESIDKAEQVEGLLNDAALQTRNAIEESNQ